MKGDGTSLVELNGGKPKVRVPRARLDDTRNGVAPGVLAIDLGSAGAEKPGERDAHGRFQKGAKAGPKKGAAAKHRASKLARDLGLATIAQQSRFAPFLRDAKKLARAVLGDLASVGRGHIGAVAGVMVQGAALQIAASRFLFSNGDFVGGSRLQNDARSSLAMARHIAGQDAVTRKRGTQLPALMTIDDAEADAEWAQLIRDHAPAAAKPTSEGISSPTNDNDAGTAREEDDE